VVSEAAGYFDEPFADSSAVAVGAVSRLAREHVKVVLSGDGGDEVFGGYYTYQADKLAAWYRKMPHAIGGRFLPWLVNKLPVSSGKQSLDFKLRRFTAGGSLPPLPAHFAWKAYFTEEMKSQLYASTFQRSSSGLVQAIRPSVTVMQHYFDRYATTDQINRLLYVDTKVQLPDDMLTKVDRMSMSHSLEVRVPLLDLRLVEFMSRLPSRLKVRGLTLKYLLKRVAARLLPNTILRRRKEGFHVPIGHWLRTDLREMLRDYLSPARLMAQGLFHPPAVERMIEAHQRGIGDYSRNLWNLFMLSLWHERFVDTACPAPSTGGQVSREHRESIVCSL
jgi:asparagine synthase (glutamine-hydrolysing)